MKGVPSDVSYNVSVYTPHSAMERKDSSGPRLNTR